MAEHVVLTYAYLRSLKAAPKGKRYFVEDAHVSGLKVMVTDRGTLSYGMKRRWPGQKQPAWRKLGDVYVHPKQKTDENIEIKEIQHGAGVLTILEARTVARSWLDQLARKVDPKAAETARKAEEAAAADREKATRFCVVAEAFKERHLSVLAKAAENKRIIDIYAKAWGDRPLKDITPIDVMDVIKPIVNAGTKYQALNVFRLGSRLYSWAAGDPVYRCPNPFTGVSARTLIGDTPPRTRILKDAEMRAVWQVARSWGIPHGATVKLLLLTGCRLEEITDLSWPEIQDNEIIIPGGRRKRIRGKTAPDLLVPLTPEMKRIIEAVPRFAAGPYLFSTTAGRKPISGFSDKKKKQLDRLSGVSDWKLHDLRRTARTHLPACGITEDVAEAMIGHTKKGIVATYNLYQYEPEKRDGFARWEKRLLSIVNPVPPDVTDLGAVRARRMA